MDMSSVDPQAPLPDWALIASGVFLVLFVTAVYGFKAYVRRSFEPPTSDEKDDKDEKSD